MRSENSIFTLILLLFWVLSVAEAQSTANWTQQMPQTSPSMRDSHALAFDSARNNVVTFGGFNGDPNSPLADTWTWNGTNWAEQSPAANPPGRYNYGLAYDSMHQQTVLFGGGTPSLLSDTWLWNGTNWTQTNPGTSPPARYGHSVVYDSARNQAVLFGGETFAAKCLNDTWVWDGSNWKQETPQNNPPARCFHAMAFDSAHNQVVLFGGHSNDTGNDFADTWLWDGSNWTQPSPASNPPARQFPALAFDSALAQVVLFGGLVSGNPAGDTWVWDGSNWTQESPQSSPSARNAPAMAYDSMHDQVVLFGGYAGSFVNDTWTYSGGSTTSSSPAVASVVSASAFGDFPAISLGGWIEIYGKNLAPHSRSWGGGDFKGNDAPTSLDGVSVTVGGQSAFVEYISLSQVNVQVPSNVATGGKAQVTVNDGMQTSQPFSIEVNATEPGLLAPAAFKIDGNQYVVAQLADGTYVLPTGAITNVKSRPAHPGEEIVFYGVGFGSVTPNIPAGQIVTESNHLALPFHVTFGQTEAQAKYDGLAPNYVGLFQFNAVVPAVPDNDLVPLTFSLGGAAGTQTLFTAVHK